MYYVLERKLTSEGITGLSNQFALGSVKLFSLLFPVKSEKLEIKLWQVEDQDDTCRLGSSYFSRKKLNVR